MNALAVYAIAAGGIFTGLFLIQTLSILTNWTNLFSVLASRHLILPFVVHRNRLCGPWSRASVLLHAIYVAVNVFLVLFRIKSFIDAGRRAGELALVNLIFPLSATHLSFLADLFGITWRTCRRIHRAAGWMTTALLAFHVVAAVQARQFSFPLDASQNLFTVIVCPLITLILLQLISARVLHHYVSLLSFRYHGFVDGRTRSFSAGIRSWPDFLSMAPGDIFQLKAPLQSFISGLRWAFWG